ncbi:hypothetical protein GCM10010103_79270 [Streptomyces paradoxus]
MAMHRRALLSSVVVGVVIACLSVLSATASQDAGDGDGQGGRFEVTDGQGRTPSANPRTAQEREAWTQDETPEQARRRIDYLESLESSRPSGSR